MAFVTVKPAMTDSSSPQTYEIEIKSLLEGGLEQVEALRSLLHDHFDDLNQVEDSQQLNHYFQGDALPQLTKKIAPHLTDAQQQELADLAEEAADYSVRTRQLKDPSLDQPKVLFVLKASIDDTTSQNGIARREFEAELADLTIDELDQLILDSGFEYQAKWSRDRQAYTSPSHNLTVSIDKNAGYGYLAEFEKVVASADQADQAVAEIRDLMAKLDISELAQDRLERMFTFYNQNWPDYYGTDKTFKVE